MLISRPLQSTLISFGLFLVLSFAIVGMSLIQVIADKHPPWYVYLILVLLAPLSLFLTFRIFINYKQVEFGNNQISVRYTVRKKIKSYPLSDVLQWRESIVKTGKNSVFKEIEIQFSDQFKVTLGLKEYSDYPRVKAYLEKKLGKKKLEA